MPVCRLASNNSSIPEVAQGSAILVNPNNSAEIAEAIYKIISDENLRNAIIDKGKENSENFSWEKCADKIAKLLETYV